MSNKLDVAEWCLNLFHKFEVQSLNLSGENINI